jgi:very-short-patch-repair endonuclease
MDVARVLADLTAASQGLARRDVLQRAGCSDGALARAVAAGTVLRVRPRIYALAPLPPRPRFVVTDSKLAAEHLLHIRAVLLSMGEATTACRRTAAALHGWGMLVEPSKVVEVSVAHGRSRVRAAGVRCVQRRALSRVQYRALPDTDPMWVTSAVQTVADCALDLPLLQAVVICDSALRAKDVSVEELRRAAARLAGVKDARRVRRVIELSDPECGSVLESVLRVKMVLADLAGFGTQRVLRDLPGLHLRVDFCFEAAGLVVEVDGARWHQDPARDQARDNDLAGLGWRVLRFTWADVVHDGERVVRDIAAAVECGRPSFHLLGNEGLEAA